MTKGIFSNSDTNKTSSTAKHTDSKTKVYQRLHGGRTVVSVRVRPELKEALKRFCKAKGLSICHITEGLWTAFLYGVNEKIELVNQSPTIDLTLVRDVKRVRRYATLDRCGFRGCSRPAVGVAVWKDGEAYNVCEQHYLEAVRSDKCISTHRGLIEGE
jgi:hypothetical protein